MRKAKQLTFTDLRMKTGRGGPRPGAGRPAVVRPIVHHVKRDEVLERQPSHVTIRVLRGVPSMRRKPFVRIFQRSLREVRGRLGFRVVAYSVQDDHVHLIVEASNKDALAQGMKAVGSRLARAVHRFFARCGRVLAGRYHVRALKSPKEVRNALAYVLLNDRKHKLEHVGTLPPVRIDAASSGRLFDGWSRQAPAETSVPGLEEVSPAQTWLLRLGWKKVGLIDPAEVPSQRKRRAV